MGMFTRVEFNEFETPTCYEGHHPTGWQTKCIYDDPDMETVRIEEGRLVLIRKWLLNEERTEAFERSVNPEQVQFTGRANVYTTCTECLPGSVKGFLTNERPWIEWVLWFKDGVEVDRKRLEDVHE